jgi:hypothetical protein
LQVCAPRFDDWREEVSNVKTEEIYLFRKRSIGLSHGTSSDTQLKKHN